MKEDTLTMPKLGLTMERGTITRILCKQGDFAKKGETILEFETEKLCEDFTAPADGYIKEILVEEGEDVEVTMPLLIFSYDE